MDQETSVSIQRSLLSMEEAVRGEIRELHEQRAAAMMSEIVELQRERDVAMAKARRLEKKVNDMEAEAAQLKRSSSGAAGDLVGLLRGALLEEQLVTKDLRRKLQNLRTVNTSLTQQLKTHQLSIQQTASSPDMRRRSVDNGAASPLTSSPQTDQPAPSSLPPTPTTLTPHTTSLENAVFHTGSSMSYSPTVVPRRYKLAAVTSREASTQTTSPTSDKINQSDHSSAEPLAPPILETLALARADIVRLQNERTAAEDKMAAEIERHDELRKKSESLQLEYGVLRCSLDEFSCWARGRLEQMEENMDIYRVIYSLHGSLSQEQSVLQDLQHRLHLSEQKVAQLNLTNRHLTVAASEAEENYQHSLSQIKVLQERLSSGRPPLPSPCLTPPSSSISRGKGRQFSSPQLPLRHSSIPTSPLTTHTPSHHHKKHTTQDNIV